MATNPKLVDLAVEVITRLSGTPATEQAAAMRLRWTLQDGSAREPIPREERPRIKTPKLGEIAWVDGFGQLRRGLVIKTTPTKCLVAYVVPSRPGDIKVADVRHVAALYDGPRRK